MLASGTQLAGYRIEGFLGKGGMGVVYVAMQSSLQRSVALKVLAREAPELEERFRREALAQAALDHPHVVPVYDAGPSERGLYIAMRLIRGSTLAAEIRRAALAPRAMLALVEPIADALDAAHAAGLVHRDVKPQNILIDARNRAYLADFGIVRPLDGSDLTQTGALVGTPDYVAPEQVLGEVATPATDVYALAAVLYECLTHSIPFAASTPQAALYARISGPPPPASTRRSDLPVTVDAALARGLARHPADRPASAVELVEQVVRALGGAPPQRLASANPYRGLDAFEEEHAELYFGRERATDALLSLLRRHSVVAVVGVSGAGKSSLLRAGLARGLAASRDPALAGRERRIIVPPEPPPDIPPEGLILAVDQFERLFADQADASARDDYIDRLIELAGEDVAVVIALRADFFAEALAHAGLARAMTQLTLLPMSDDELLRAIEEPARQRGRTFESGLPQRLVDDVRGHAGDLPLLEFALYELWETDAARGTLTASAYDALGYTAPDGTSHPGVRGAIAARAESVWTDLDGAERTTARRVFLSLVSSAGTARRAPLGDLGTAERAVASRLADARLLTLGEHVELSHEALIRAWPRFARWVEEHRPFLRWRDVELGPLWRLWLDSDRKPDYLLPPAALDRAREFRNEYPDELGPEQVTYIDASIEAHASELELARRANRRLRGLSAALVAGLLLAVAIGALAVVQARRANRTAATADSRRLADRAGDAFDGHLDVALLLSLEAWRIADTYEARNAAAVALGRTERTAAVLRNRSTAPVTLIASAGGRVAARDDRSIALYDLGRRRLVRRFTSPRKEAPEAIALSPGGDLVAARYLGDGTVLWADDGTSRPLRGDAEVLAFSRDGARLAASSRGVLTVWDAADGRRVFRAGGDDPWSGDAVGFSRDGHEVAAVGGGHLRVWTIGVRRPRLDISLPVGLQTRMLISSDLRYVGGGDLDLSLRLWDVRHAQPDRLASAKGARDAGQVFSPDGSEFAAAMSDGTVRIWKTSNVDIAPRVVVGNRDAVSVAWDGTQLAVGGASGLITVWELAEPSTLSTPVTPAEDHSGGFAHASTGAFAWGSDSHLFIERPHAARRAVPFEFLYATDLDFSPDGDRLVLADNFERLRVLDVDGPRPLTLDDGDASPISVAFGPDGLVASGDVDGTLRLWSTAGPGRVVQALNEQGADQGAVAFSRDGRSLAASSGTDIAVYGVDNRRLSGRRLLRGHVGNVRAIAFSPDGRTLASGAEDGTVRLWRMPAGTSLTDAPLAASSTIGAVAFTPDGRTLAATAEDGPLQFWDVATRQPLGEPLARAQSGWEGLSFSPDGKTLVSSGGRGFVHWSPMLWARRPEQLQERLCAIAGRSLTSDEWSRYLPERSYHRTCG